MAITYYSIPQSDFKLPISLVVTELNLRLEREDYEDAKKLSRILKEFLPPMGGNNHLIRKDSLKVADEIINKPHISILGEVAFNMDANLITFENGKWTEYKRERVGNKISLIEIKVGA